MKLSNIRPLSWLNYDRGLTEQTQTEEFGAQHPTGEIISEKLVDMLEKEKLSDTCPTHAWHLFFFHSAADVSRGHSR